MGEEHVVEEKRRWKIILGTRDEERRWLKKFWWPS
jgi:hypothetical protein